MGLDVGSRSSAMSRRLLLRRATATAGSLAVVGLLAACGAAAPGTVAPATGSSAASSAAPLASSSAAVSSSSAAPSSSASSVASSSSTSAQTVASAAPSSSAVTSSSASATAGAASGSKVIYGTFADAKILTPFLSSDTASSDVEDRIFEGLLATDPDTGLPIPWLAEKWDQSPDALTYTFHLRKDVTWHDGQPFTAEDAKFTYDTIMDPKTKTVRKTNYEQVKAFTVVDPSTFQVTLKQPFCPFLTSMTNGLVPKHLLQNSADINTDPFGTKSPVGTGPYKFSEWVKDDHVTLVANPNYWGGAPKIQQWIMKIVPNATVVAQQLKTGDVDASGIEPKDLADMEKQQNVNITKYYGRTYDFIGYNVTNPLFQDKRVRQAFTYALNRDVFIQKILFGQGQPINSSEVPINWAYDPNLPKYPFDPTKAKSLMKEAGWAPGPDGILQKGGVPFKFTLITNSGNTVREQIVTIAQQQLKDIGVSVAPQLMEWNAFLDKVTKNHQFDACVLGWAGLGPDPDQRSLWHSSQIKDGLNFIGYNNPEVDKLLDQARTLPGCDQQTRKDLYYQFQQILADEQPYTFLYNGKSLAVVNKRLQGTHITAYGGLFWQLNKWTLAP